MKNLLFCLMLLSSTSFAGTDKTPVEGESGSSGTRGGGESVDSRLRDLVDPATCIVQKGDRFADRHAAGWRNILKKLENVDWYFAFVIEREIKKLTICQVRSSLKRLVTTDPDSFTYYQNDKTHEMVGLRDFYTVYVSTPALNRLPSYDKAYFVIHEAMHEFVQMNEERRNEKVRGIVKAIESIVRDEIDWSSYNDTLYFYSSKIKQYDQSCEKTKELGQKLLGNESIEKKIKYISKESMSDFDHLRANCSFAEDQYTINEIVEERNKIFLEAIKKGDTKIIQEMLPTIDANTIRNGINGQYQSPIGLLLNLGLKQMALDLLLSVETNSYGINSELMTESNKETVESFPLSLKDFIPNRETIFTKKRHRTNTLSVSLKGYCGYYRPQLLSRAIIEGDEDIFKLALSKPHLEYSLHYGLTFLDSKYDDSRAPNSKLPSTAINVWSPLSLSVIFNRIEMLKAILSYPGFNKDELQNYKFVTLNKARLTMPLHQFPGSQPSWMRCQLNEKPEVSPYTIVDLAVRQGYFEIARLLENAGAKCRHKCKELRSHK